jgi:hypothetical protein
MTVRTPVAMMVFNRPELTARLFEVVRAARPSRLLVVADGPRLHRPGEAEACARVRSVLDRVDWPCEVEREFAAANLGCRQRISSGLDWVFRQAEEAIILEDDCIPDPAFFRFCDELLERYRDDERVMAVTGCNYQFGRRRGMGSYYFSHHMHVWGWASWRRAWRHYDVRMDEWPALRRGRWLRDALGSRAAAALLRYRLDLTRAGRIDTWDYQWSFAVLRRGGLVATPNVNLVRNVGAGEGATHPEEESPLHSPPVGSLDTPLIHPAEVRRDVEADAFVQRFFMPSVRMRLSIAVRRILGLAG